MSAHRLFGILLDADLNLPGGLPQAADGGSSVRMRRRAASEIVRDWPDGTPSWSTRIEDVPIAVTRVPAGGFAVRWGDSGRLRFDPSAGELHWAVDDPSEPRWLRFVLDTVGYLIALEIGHEALHAGAIVVEGRAVAIAAPSGEGKSTLLAALLAEGAELLTDDILALEPTEKCILAHPGPPLMNLPANRRITGHEVLDAFGDELWTVVPVAGRAVPLATLVLLGRRGAAADSETTDPSLLAVLPRLLAFPRTRARERSRFELAGRIAEEVRVHRLCADAGTPPTELAARMLDIASAQAGAGLR